MSTADNLIRMANQIAQNLAARGEAEAVAQTAQHIRAYWDPRMKAALLSGDRAGLSALAAAAVERIATETQA